MRQKMTGLACNWTSVVFAAEMALLTVLAIATATCLMSVAFAAEMALLKVLAIVRATDQLQDMTAMATA